LNETNYFLNGSYVVLLLYSGDVKEFASRIFYTRLHKTL